MPGLSNYETDEDPEEYARRVCKWHADNEGPPLTHEEVMIVHLQMADPESRRRCKARVQALTASGGEFEHLRLNAKFAVSRRHVAERQSLPYRRVRRLPVINRMRVVEKQRKALASREYLPDAVKEPTMRVLDTIEQRTARYLSIGSAYELLEGTREFSSAANNALQLRNQMIDMLEGRVAYLEDALLASLGGQRLLPQPSGEGSGED